MLKASANRIKTKIKSPTYMKCITTFSLHLKTSECRQSLPQK